MSRALYRVLVKLHPPAFRREFAWEMLWIFDETALSGSTRPLFGDALVSLMRQWLLRTGWWKFVLIAAGALFQMGIGGILWFSFGRVPGPTGVPMDQHPELAAMMRLCALVAVGLLGSVLLLVFWWRGLARRIGG
jgi:hypothetical protein